MAKKKKPNNYKITLQLAGVKYKQEGKTIEEAFEKFDLGWWQVKNKCIVTISKGKKSHEHLFTARVLKRILINPTLRGIWSQKLNYLMK